MTEDNIRFNIGEVIKNTQGAVDKHKVIISAIIMLSVLTAADAIFWSWAKILAIILVPIAVAMLVFGIYTLNHYKKDLAIYILYLGCMSAYLSLLTFIGELKLIDYRYPLPVYAIILTIGLFCFIHYLNYLRHHQKFSKNRKTIGETRYNPWSSVAGTVVLVVLYKTFGYRFNSEFFMFLLFSLGSIMFFVIGIFGTSNIYNYLLIKKLGIDDDYESV